MAKIWQFIKTHGFLIMITGFFISAVSLIVFMIWHNNFFSLTRQISFATTIAGFCIYVCGRILLTMQRKIQKQQKSALF